MTMILTAILWAVVAFGTGALLMLFGLTLFGKILL